MLLIKVIVEGKMINVFGNIFKIILLKSWSVLIFDVQKVKRAICFDSFIKKVSKMLILAKIYYR